MLFHKRIGPLATVLALALSGCATKDGTSRESKPGHGIIEYQEITTGAIKAVRGVLESLNRTASYPDGVPSHVRSAFIKEVERLEVDSVQVRARAQAILARGDAYFQNWQANLEQVEDPTVRELAREHRPELETSFGRIKSGSQQARQAFQPFLAGLRKLRTAVENDRDALASGTLKELARTTAEQGRKVEQELAGIQNELKNMMAVLKLPHRT